MRNAAKFGGPLLLGKVADQLEKASSTFESHAKAIQPGSVRPPADTQLILDIAASVDRYYGSSDARSDAMLLWNSSSGLAHAENWYGALFGGATSDAQKSLAMTLTNRSFDIACSAANVLGLRVLSLASQTTATDSPE